LRAESESAVSQLALSRHLHRLFEHQAERTPQARAIVAHDGQLSYAELNSRSNQLAHYLKSLGVGLETRVGIALPRSAEIIVASLAVLKAGAAYVPVDPAYPLQRFKYLVEDSGACVLLTHRLMPEGLNQKSIRIVPLESHWERVEGSPECNLASKGEDANLAYVIYTSGTTGRPKGAMVSHANVVSSTQARAAYYVQPPGRFLMLSSLSFDSSVAGIFWTLLNGGELWLPPEGAEKNVARIAEFVRHGDITHLLALPSLYKSLLLHSTNNELASLRTIIVAGEPCPADLVTAHFHHLPDARLFNEYGPTEMTVWCTVYEASPTRYYSSVPIGTPLPALNAYILNPLMEPVDRGEAGELYMGGPQVARGYLHRPDLTAERFLPDPFAELPGARLYRTGDLARRTEEGEIDFLGRTDQQVKIRGHRVELGEIESALRQHPQVREVVVAGKKDGEDRQRLVAYLVPWEGTIDPAALRSFLRQTLPEYMIPATYVSLGALPLNPNGKLDRQSLPDPGPPESQNAYVAPRTQVEQKLAQIWSDVLGVQQVGMHDNFFELGGDSILGLQMAAHANRAGLRLNITQLIEQPTLAGLAAACMPAGAANQQPQTILPVSSYHDRWE
jgi:amino acid adenylation domain-containing protein